jgi:DNA-binding beta-propeller fold protein YncE
MSIAVAFGFASLAHGQGCVPNTANYPCVYVASQTSTLSLPSLVSVINATTNTVIGHPIAMTTTPYIAGIAVTPDNQFALVLNSNVDQANSVVTIIATSTNTIAASVGLQGVPLQIAVAPDNSQAWIAESGSSVNGTSPAIEILDLATQKITAIIHRGQALVAPTAIAFTSDSTLAYVADTCFTVSAACMDQIGVAIQSTNGQFPIPGTLGNQPASIAVVPGGPACMTAVQSGGGADLELACLATGSDVSAFMLMPTGQSVVPSNYGAAIVPTAELPVLYIAAPADANQSPLSQAFVFDPGFNMYLGPVNVPGTNGEPAGPAGLSVSADGKFVYVTDSNINSISVIDTAAAVVVRTIALPSEMNEPTPAPLGVAAMPSIPPLIITQPASQTVDYKQTATLTVTATGTAPFTYQWYQGQSGDTSTPIAGATSNTFTTPNLTATTSYWVAVSNIVFNGTPNSATATLTVTPVIPTITAQPASQTITGGQVTTLSVVASGTGPLSYQWYKGQSGDTSSPVEGATSFGFTTPVLEATTSYWVLVSNTAGKVDSVSATITVTPVAPTITTQPTSQTITGGHVATLSVVATGTPPLSYQWYQGQSGNTSSPIAGASSSTYTTPPQIPTTSYWVRVSDSAGRVDSATATITVTPVAPVVTTQPISQTITAGQVATLNVVATGTPPLGYQWFQGLSGDTSTPIAGATAASYTTSVLNTTASYWVLVSHSAGQVNSATATIIVIPVAPTIATQPGNQTIISGQVATLGVLINGTPPFTYQWFQGQSENTTTPIVGATGPTYTTPSLTATTSYWVLVSNRAGEIGSATATVTVTPITPSITTQPASQTIVGGQVATLSVVAAGTPPFTYQWYQGQSGNTSTPIAGATSSSYVTSPLAQSTSYWVLVSNSVASMNSTTAVITVNQVPTCTLAVQGTETSDFQTLFTVRAIANCVDPQGSPLNILISWGDGTPPATGIGASLTATHTYPAPVQSSYTNTVVATDALGLKGTVSYSTTLVSSSQVPGVFGGQSSDFMVSLASPTSLPMQVTFQCTTATDSSGNVHPVSALGLSCAAASGAVGLTGTPQNVALGIQTSGIATGRATPEHARDLQETLFYSFVLPLPGLVLWALRHRKDEKRRKVVRHYGALFLLFAVILHLTGCGAGGFTLPTKTPPASSNTPAVNYQVTIVDNPANPSNSIGFVQISLIVPLTVSPPQ